MQILKQSEYFGVQRLELLQRGLSLSEYDYLEPGTPWHYHENPYFMYVIGGNMVDMNKGKSSLLSPGSMMFLNWEDVHRTEKRSTRGRGFHLQIDRQWLRRYEIEASLWEGSQALNHPDFHLVLGKIYFEFRRADSFSALSVEMLVLQLCSMLTHKFTPSLIARPPWMSRLVAILHESEERLSLKELSEELGVHPVHISRTVPNFLDNTLGEYLRKRQVSRAIPLLLNPDETLAQIALTSGFSDQSHFTRVFKSYCGVTPAKFRRSN